MCTIYARETNKMPGFDPHLNILYMPYRREFIYRLSDAWQDLIRVVKEPAFQLSLQKLNDIQGKSKPIESLLTFYGERNMTVGKLASYIDMLGLEIPLSMLKAPEPLRITEQFVNGTKLTADSMDVFTVNLSEGDRLVLELSATGFPYPRYTWFFGKSSLPEYKGNCLIIDKVCVHNSGAYMCRVHNKEKKLEELQWTKWVKVNVQKMISYECDHTSMKPNKEPTKVRIQFGNPLLLKNDLQLCDGALAFQWSHNDKIIPSERGAQLLIPGCGREQSGIYECRIFTENGTLLRTDQTFVEILIPDSDAPPEIIADPIGGIVGLNGRITLEIVARGVEPLTYLWFFNGSPIGWKNSSLPIHCNEHSKFGRYQCQVIDKHDRKVLSKEALLRPERGQCLARDKVALLIGNSAYKGEEDLPAVYNDIHSLRKVLTALSFKVTAVVDLTKKEMDDIVQYFCSLVTEGVYVFIFCAGHGYVYETHKQHYLLPIDSKIGGDPSPPDQCLCLEWVEQEVQKRNPKLCFIAADFCRQLFGIYKNENNKFPMYHIKSKQPNSVTFYAASYGQNCFEPDQPTSSSIFCEAFVKNVVIDCNCYELYCHLRKSIDVNGQLQNPEFRTDLKDTDTSLHDKIHFTGHTAEVEKIRSLWMYCHQPPPNIPIVTKNGDVIRCHFETHLSNILSLEFQLLKQGTSKDIMCKVMEDKYPEIKPIVHKMENNAPKAEIRNLQKLKKPLDLDVELTLDGEVSLYRIELGFPLVSKLLQHQRSITNLPGEHEEEWTSLESDSSKA